MRGGERVEPRGNFACCALREKGETFKSKRPPCFAWSRLGGCVVFARGPSGGTRVIEPRTVLVLSTRPDVEETRALLEALGYAISASVVQIRSRPDKDTYLGRGRVAETAEWIRETHPPASTPRPLVVVNGELRPSQLFNLEDKLHVEVWDRIRVILEIFQQKARVKEARLQVELARLRYELPFVHEALHRQLTGEHPGFMGGGEVEARTYETHLKRRTKLILEELNRIKKERSTRRAGRRKTGSQLLAITGYTNSGKSSLFNVLCESKVRVENQVFSTLETTTRRLQAEYAHSRSAHFLLTDTVGFIQNLPPWLVEAFASTLEEVTYADVVVFVIDASEPLPTIQRKVAAARAILEELHAPRRFLSLLNKADLLNAAERQRLRGDVELQRLLRGGPHLFTSAITKEGLREFVNVILDNVLATRIATLILDRTQSAQAALEAWLHERTEILHQTETPTQRVYRVRCTQDTWGLLLREVKRSKARLQSEDSTSNKGGSPGFIAPAA